MLSREALRDLFLHMAWADAKIWRAVVASEAARLRAVGGGPPLVDYIAWICFGRPSPRGSG